MIVHYVGDDVACKLLHYVADRVVVGDVTDARHDADGMHGGRVRHDVIVVVKLTQHGVEYQLDGRRDDAGGRGGTLTGSGGGRVEGEHPGEERHVPGQQHAAAADHVAMLCRRRRPATGGFHRRRRSQRTFAELICIPYRTIYTTLFVK